MAEMERLIKACKLEQSVFACDHLDTPGVIVRVRNSSFDEWHVDHCINSISKYKAQRQHKFMRVVQVTLDEVSELAECAISPLELDSIVVVHNFAELPTELPAGFGRLTNCMLRSPALCTNEHPWLGRPIDRAFDWRKLPTSVVAVGCDHQLYSYRARQQLIVRLLMLKWGLPRDLAGGVA